MTRMFILLHERPVAHLEEHLAVSVGIDPLWQLVLGRKHTAKDRRTLSRPSTRDDFAGGEQIWLSEDMYRIKRIDVV